MHVLRPAHVTLSSHPAFLIAPMVILGAATVEALWLQHSRGSYDWRAYAASLGDLILRFASGLLPLGLAAAALNALWPYRFFDMPLDSVWVWPVLFVRPGFLLLLDAPRRSSGALALGHALRASFTPRIELGGGLPPRLDRPLECRAPLFRAAGGRGIFADDCRRRSRGQFAVPVLAARRLDSAARAVRMAVQHTAASSRASRFESRIPRQ